MRSTIWHGALALVAACWLAAWPAAAHNGGDVEWADETVGPLTGTASRFSFQFPHVFFEMDVAGTPWTITTRWTPTILREHGWSRDSIKPGDKVTVTYRPHVEKSQVGQMATVEINGAALPLSF